MSPSLPRLKCPLFWFCTSFCFFWLLRLKNFSLASLRNDDPLLGRPTGSLFFCPVGLARSVALRSPQGYALRAKCRARPTTNAARWRPTWKLASAPSGGAVHLRFLTEIGTRGVALRAAVSRPCGCTGAVCTVLAFDTSLGLRGIRVF